jgi:hypothetical protein
MDILIRALLVSGSSGGGGCLRWWVALLLAIAGTLEARCQTVALGDANFAGDSDQISADWFWPMPSNVTYTYVGFGDFAGATFTETYIPGQWIAGVRTIKRHVEVKIPSTASVKVREWWMALDVNGNLRVLKIVDDGVTEFAASDQQAPAICLPGNPANGQTWNCAGNTVTIESVTASRNAGATLKVSIAAPGSGVEYRVYNAGVGVVQYSMSESPRPSGSGWRLRMQ